MLLTSHWCWAQQEEKSIVSEKTKIDSLLRSYSIEEILDFHDYYQRRLDAIETERNDLREKGISDAEKFIANNPESRVLDRVLMRLAELYYEKADDEFLTAMQQYDRKIKQMDSAGTEFKIEEPVRDYSKPLAIYERLINKFPHSHLVDDALYNKGYILEEIGRTDSALSIYHLIIDEFPDSRYVTESLMRIAEHYFNPPLNQIDTAIDYYKKILKYEESPKYDEALYRLGWCYYRLSDFLQAVSYFTLLVEDIERAKQLDTEQRYSSPDLHDEALEYIALSFLDYGGLSAATDYLNSLNNPSYGFNIFRKIGDVYLNDKEEYQKAIAAYARLLKTYPEANDAPAIEEKIVRCYRLMGNDQLVYLARDKLFNQYKPGSQWWTKHDDEEVRAKTCEITERAVRDNITMLFQRAEIDGGLGLYELAVNDCQKYLKHFPGDSSAPRIHWNMALTMDTRLKQHDQAFEEYMKISDLYWDSKFQRYAAENAIALGRDAVEADTTHKSPVVTPDNNIDFREIPGDVLAAFYYKQMALTNSEIKLVRAFNNYIKLYPHEPNTVKILYNAGVLYFNNNLFKEALRYFNTIVKHFPEHETIPNIQHQIMESYFGKGDYRSAEIVAQRIKNDSTMPPELVEKAKRRLAESIFLAAKVLADSADHLQAGNEYLRVVREAPYIDFADLSLFNAACEYDKAREFSRAVETYNYLIETQAESNFKFDAMNNLAIDYGELFEYKNAALTYERLAAITKDSLQVHDALYNSSLFFARAEEWENAIRINTRFVENFTDSDDADDLFYDIATYYLRLDKLAEANQIYGEYAEKFPDSPRVVETFFHRGKYFESKGDLDSALNEYDKAVSKNQLFQQRKMDTNDYYAAEALSSATKIKHNEFKGIDLYLPPAKMEVDRKRKRDLLIEVVNGFTQVVAFGTIHLYEATFNIGKAYEEFADSWMRQEIPPMDRTRRIVAQKEINETAVELYRKAEESYRQSIDILRKLANNYEQSLVLSDTAKTTPSELQKIVSRDSTLHIARRWIERCENQMSKVIYDMAELQLATIQFLFKAPIPEDLTHVEQMEYQKQVIKRAVEPLVNSAVDEHVRNVREAWKLGIDNKWVKESRKKIVTTNNILATEYSRLAQQALDYYTTNWEEYERFIKRDQRASFVFDAITLADNLAALLGFWKDFTSYTMLSFHKSLDLAATENIQDPTVILTEESLFQQVYHFAVFSDSLARLAYSKKKFYDKLYKDTKNLDYEDALFVFEDNYFSIKENSIELLESAHQLSKEMSISNRWATRALLQLVELKPKDHYQKLGLEIKTSTQYSDRTWRVSVQYEQGWTNPSFADSSWDYAEFVDNQNLISKLSPPPVWLTRLDTSGFKIDTTVAVAFDTVRFSEELDSSRIVKFISDSLSRDTTVVLRSDRLVTNRHSIVQRVSCDRVYFRKEIMIPGLPVSAEIKIQLDDSYNFFFNGEYISTFSGADSTMNQENSIKLSDALVAGSNVMAIECVDQNATGGGLIATITVSSLPDWQEKKRQILMETSDEMIKKNLVMDKYIILY